MKRELTISIAEELPVLPSKAEPNLNRRESEILALSVMLTTRQIAEHLGIKENTVQAHFLNIFEKLHCNSRTEALLIALAADILRLEVKINPDRFN